MIRTAVIGGGWVSTARHLPTMKRHGGFDVVGIVAQNESAARSSMERFGIRHFARTLEEASFLDEVDACVIGTPPFVHAADVRFCLERGKDVLCEKPMTVDSAETARLVELARSRGAMYGVVHNFQFARSTLAAKELIARGEVGPIVKILGVQLGNPKRRLPTWYEELPFGLFYDESPHFMYLFQAFGGRGLKLLDATHVPSRSGLKTPHSITAQLATSAGTPITLHCEFEAPVSEWYLVILGEKRVLVLDVFRDILQSLPNDELHTAFTIARTTSLSVWQSLVGYARSGVSMIKGDLLYGNPEVFARFARAVSTRRMDPEISADAGLEANRLQDAIVASSRPLVYG